MIHDNIRLISQKAKRIDQRTKCGRCEGYYNTVYRYTESNIGPICLCPRCKEIIREKSFGSIQIHQEGLVGRFISSGGAWESNRHKH